MDYPVSADENGVNFNVLYDFLISHDFEYVCSTKYKTKLPPMTNTSYVEFDSLFRKK